MPASHGRPKDDVERSRSALTIDRKGGSGMSLIDPADGVAVGGIKAKTAADFKVAPNSGQSDAALWRLQ
ncbi:hypothetical protein [Microvirga sp. VF16]|uniref:hypothetical protein n=1 Tax=Microvirga sp. VF16 TaxID=2807101 RepID=UPI00193DEE8D|nr:hypothetical protein [Microvirga sp. VF16]QRM32990.1 hypothetical protein JO965_27060 [Microvirga sp. VF16]